MLGICPTIRRQSGGSGQRRSWGHIHMIGIGDSFIMTVNTLLRWAHFVRRNGGLGSDNDRTDETLRERENVARERSGDNDRLLLGLILLQRIPPARLHVGAVETSVAAARNCWHAGLGAAMVMTVMLASARAASGPADSARVMMVMMQIKITDGGETQAAGGPTVRARAMIVVMMIKTRSARPASFSASQT